MGVADGRVCDKASDRAMSGDMSKRERPLQQLPQAQAAIGAADGNAYGPIDCGPADAKIARSAGVAAEAAAVEPAGGVVNESSPVAAINCADTCRAVVAEQRLNADGNESGCEYRHQPQQLSHHHHHQHHLHHLHHHHHLNHHHNHQLKQQQQHQQQHPQQQHHHHHHQSGNQQAEVRRLCQNNEFKDEKDKININHQKNTFKQQQHFHHNHNNQHVYPQLQYEPAQQILTANTPHNQSTPISTPPQPPQQVMAHYKFHNDCQSSVLTYEQVKRLDFVMDQVVPVHGRGNAPTLYVKLKELIRSVKHKLHEHSIEIRDVRLNGGASNYVLAPENSHYNDLDLILGTDLSNEDRFDVIRDVVLECLMEFYPKELHQQMEDQEGEEEGGEEEGEKKQGGHVSGASSMANSEGAKQEVEMANDEMHIENSSSRSDRSSSFESDNLNITNNELDVPSEEEQEDDDDDDDEEDNIIVTIDSDDDFRIKKPAASGPEVTSTTPPEPNFGSPVEGPSGDSEEAAETIAKASSCASHQVDTQAVHYQHLQMPLNKSAIKEAYVHKMVKVNDDDRWSLISLGVQPSETNNYNLMQQHQSAEGAEGVPLCCVQAQSEGSATSRKDQQSIRACQQSQLPNSIELKFVDRMRRKFEFSVDSFQIILDSLIQFYDYAPQSTITIQRTPSSFMNSIIGRRASCGQCCGLRMIQQGTLDRNCGEKEIDKFLDNTNESSMKKKKKKQQQQPQNSKQSNNNNKDASLNASRAFYDLPLEPNLSNSSVASSSGCSSSSSVVSSSSSSLSCDEDHEDLDCDVDSSPSSSSASTSSLLSATTAASLSMSSGADQLCDPRAQLETIDGVSSPPAASMGAGEHEMGAERDQRGAQKLTTQSAKQAKEGSSKNDCAGSESRKCMQTECDIETSKLSSCAVISENFYPTVIGRSEYGNFKEALYHLEKKLIATRSPEEIRGGGLLKYCNLLVKNYKPTNVLQIRTLERYMCSRFFIDFSDLNQQRAKLESYLANHFSDDPMQKYHYLTILHNVVQRSTVCLMNHELRLTLNMIRELAYELNEQHQQLQSSQSLHQSQQAQRRAALCEQQPLFSQPQPQPQSQPQSQSQSRQKVDQPEAQYQQQAKQTVMQSGVYRVKLVNYALAKPIKS